jgi:hypothetical protein
VKRLRVEIIRTLDASDLNSEEGEDSLEGGDMAPANLGGDRKDDQVGVGLEEDEDDFSTAGVGEDTSTVVGAGEEGDDTPNARPSSRASVSSGVGSVAVTHDRKAATVVRANSTTSGRQSSSSASSATGRRPATHMTPLSRPRTRQRGNSPDSSGDRIGNIMAMMMMNQASGRDERRQEREERREEFCLSLEMQHQQMQQQQQQMHQQQNVMTILLMNAVGMTNCQQQQVGFGNNSMTDNQQQPNLGDEEQSKE